MCYQLHILSQLDFAQLSDFHTLGLCRLCLPAPLFCSRELCCLLAGLGQRQKWLSSVGLASDLGSLCVPYLRGTAFLVILFLPSVGFLAFSYIKVSLFPSLVSWRQQGLLPVKAGAYVL